MVLCYAILFIWGCHLPFPPRCFFLLVYLAFLLSSHVLVVHSGVRVEMTKLIEGSEHKWGLFTRSFTRLIWMGQFSYLQFFPIGMVTFPRACLLGEVFWGGIVGWSQRGWRSFKFILLAFSKGHSLHCYNTCVVSLFNSAFVSPKVAIHSR